MFQRNLYLNFSGNEHGINSLLKEGYSSSKDGNVHLKSETQELLPPGSTALHVFYDSFLLAHSKPSEMNFLSSSKNENEIRSLWKRWNVLFQYSN